MFNAIFQDLKFAVRGLVKNAGFSALTILILALGVGATTAIFSVVYGVLLRPLPYPKPDRIVAVWEVNHRGTFSRLADPNFDDFRDQSRSFQAMAKYAEGVESVSGTSEPTRTSVASVTRDFFKVLDIQPVRGRTFVSEDSRQGAAPVLLASYGYWKLHLGAAQDLSPIKLRIGGRAYSVAGILPEGFAFPGKTDLWVPSELDPENTSRTSHNYSAIGRLRDGVTVAQANADLSAIARSIAQQSTEKSDYLLKDAAAIPLQSSLTGRVRSPLYILLGAVSFLLLVACANVANSLLAQASSRQRELAIRSALGASRSRIVVQFITEMSLLSVFSCAAGAIVAVCFVRGLVVLAPPDLPNLPDVSVSLPTLAFAAGISLLVAFGLGVFTAVRATGGDSSEKLTEGGRGNAGTQRSQRVGRAIVAAQLAITMVLLVGAGLLGRSLLRVLSVDPGFRTDHIVTIDLELPVAESANPSTDANAESALAVRTRQSQVLTRLLERLHAIPGVEQVAAVNAVPMDGGLPDGTFLVMGSQDSPKTFKDLAPLYQQVERRGVADFCSASPEYFKALGIPLIRGRLFESSDSLSSPHAAIINQALARSRWPNQDSIGQTIEFGNMDGDLHVLTIVGIVGDTHEFGLEQPPRPTIYVNMLQRPQSSFSIVVHAEAEPGSIDTAARGILRQEVPEVAPSFRTFTEIYSASLGSRHFNLTLVAVFALTALLLAVAGVYGVIAYGVAQRTREIGVRMALGARKQDVLGMILGQGLRTTLIGILIGLAGSFAITRAIQSLLFGVEATDPLTFFAVPALLAAVATMACYIPARRAAKVDPIIALRYE